MTELTSNVRHLSVLCAVVRRGSISGAARATHLSQPAATQAIAALEREFGAPLFARTPRGMRPTDAGRLCAARVARALERIAEAVAGAGRPARGATSAIHGITAAQLQALIAVVEAGGFGPAARALGVTRRELYALTSRQD
jgi:DNA-binding transcriptional LysR family regulator